MKNLKIYIFIVIIIVAFIGSLIFKFFINKSPESTEAAAPRTGLVGHWTMDTNDMSATGATLYDKSGYGNNGTITGTTTSTGRIGQSRTFNGTSDYINVGRNSTFDNFGKSGQWTFSFWAKPSTTGGSQYVMGNRDSVNNYGVSFLIYDSTPTSDCILTIYGVASYTFTSCNPLDNKWHLWTLAVSVGSSAAVYRDGILVSNQSVGAKANATTYSLYIGALNNGGSAASPFSGSIDDVRIYNRALSPSEVSQLYDSAKRTYK